MVEGEDTAIDEKTVEPRPTVEESPFVLEMHQVSDLPMTFDELMQLPRRLSAARDAWKLARELYDEGILSYEEQLAVRAGARAILGLPVDE